MALSEVRNSRREYRFIEMSRLNYRGKSTEDTMKDIWSKVKMCKACVIGVLRGQENIVEALSEEAVTKNFPKYPNVITIKISGHKFKKFHKLKTE